jgi:hypothetical protein
MGEGCDVLQRVGGGGLSLVGGGGSLMTHSAGSVTIQSIAFKYMLASGPLKYT